MKEPTTAEEVKVLHDLLRSDPRRYLQIVEKWIADNPDNSHAYFDRHFAWMKLGEPKRAIADLNMVIRLDPKPVAFWSRGEVIAASANTRKPQRILIAPRPSILRNGQRLLSDWLSKPIVMPGWVTRLPHWLIARACMTTFGPAASKGLLAAAKLRFADKLRLIAADARRQRA